MNVLILHDVVSETARADELDALVQADVIGKAMSALGHECSVSPFSWNLQAAEKHIRERNPDLVVNLVEAVNGSGRWVYLAPALLDEMRLAYTGSGTDAMFVTANKLLTKRLLHAHGIATPQWFEVKATEPRSHGATEGSEKATKRRSDQGKPYPGRNEQCAITSGRFIIKSVWEEASVGLDEDSVIEADDESVLAEAIARRLPQLGGFGFAEEFIDGREFNLSLLAGGARWDSFISEGGAVGPQVLPPAEIDFVDYAPDKPKVVGYRAKWDAESFEYHHTPRRFEFPAKDAALLETLRGIALDCWRILGLRGYVRVDFRVDSEGRPWVLEVNANPCLSPDAGFFAAAQQAGLTFDRVVERIIADAQCDHRIRVGAMHVAEPRKS